MQVSDIYAPCMAVEWENSLFSEFLLLEPQKTNWQAAFCICVYVKIWFLHTHLLSQVYSRYMYLTFEHLLRYILTWFVQYWHRQMSEIQSRVLHKNKFWITPKTCCKTKVAGSSTNPQYFFDYSTTTLQCYSSQDIVREILFEIKHSQNTP